MARLFTVIGCVIAAILIADSVMHDPDVRPFFEGVVRRVDHQVERLNGEFGASVWAEELVTSCNDVDAAWTGLAVELPRRDAAVGDVISASERELTLLVIVRDVTPSGRIRSVDLLASLLLTGALLGNDDELEFVAIDPPAISANEVRTDGRKPFRDLIACYEGEELPDVATPIVAPTRDLTQVPANTPIPTKTSTATPTNTATPEPMATGTSVPTNTATIESTATETAVPTNTATTEPTATESAISTDTATTEPTATETAMPTDTATAEPTATETAMPTDTATTEPTATETAMPTDTATAEPTATETAIPTNTATAEPTATETAIPTNTAITEPTATETAEPTNTATPEPTATETAVPTNTATTEPTATETAIPTLTATTEPTPTETAIPTLTATAEPTSTATAIPTLTATTEPTATETAEPTNTATPEPTATETAVPTNTPTTEPTATESAVPTDTATAESTDTETATPTSSATSGPTSTVTAIPTATPLFDSGTAGTFEGWIVPEGWSGDGSLTTTGEAEVVEWVAPPVTVTNTNDYGVESTFTLGETDECPRSFGVAIRGSETAYLAGGIEWNCGPAASIWIGQDRVAEQDIEILPGAHTLRFQAVGNDVTLILDGQTVAQITTDEVETGSIVAFWSAGVPITIDDVQVVDMSASAQDSGVTGDE